MVAKGAEKYGDKFFENYLKKVVRNSCWNSFMLAVYVGWVNSPMRYGTETDSNIGSTAEHIDMRRI